MSDMETDARPGAHRIRRFLYGAIAAVVAVAGFAFAVARHLSPDLVLRPALENLHGAAGIDVRYQRSRFAWGEIILEGVQVGPGPAPRNGAADGAGAGLGRITLRPSFWGFLLGRSGAPWHAVGELYGGTLRGRLEELSGEGRCSLEWTGVDIALLRNDSAAADISGSSDGRLDTYLQSGAGRERDGSWEVRGSDIEAEGLKSGSLVFPPIHVTHLHSVGSWAGRTATVSALDADSSFGVVHLSGTIILRTPVEQSALKLQLAHTPPREVSAEVALLMRTLLPPAATQGRGNYRVGGTLATPILTPVASP
jgi:type II secretion system protein N